LGIRQDLQHISDRASLIGQFRQGQVTLNLIAIPATVSLLDDISGIGQISHDGVRVSLGNAEVRGEISQADVRILRDAEQRPTVVGEEAPISHG
jgi:hypothetical protein